MEHTFQHISAYNSCKEYPANSGTYSSQYLNYTIKTAKILTMINFEFETPKEISSKIAENMRALRKDRKLSMEKLAEASGVSYGSIKRFESTGEIALVSLLKIAIVLDCTEDFLELFAKRPPQSIQEIIDGKV